MIYLAPLDLQSLLRLLCLLSENSGFSYEEMMNMPSHILLNLWNTKRTIKEEQNKEEQKAYDQSGAQNMQNMNPQTLMGQAKGMMPQMPKMGNFSMPSIGSFHT
jgi:hypothetical protein